MYIFHTVRTNHKATRIFAIFNYLYPWMCVYPHACQCTRRVDGKSSVLLLWTPSWNPWKLQDHRTSLSQIRDALLPTLVPQRAPTSRVRMGLAHNSPSLPGLWLAPAQFFQIEWAEILRKSCTQCRIFAEWKRTVFMELQWEFMTFLPKALWGPSQESNGIFSQESHCHFCLSPAACKEDTASVYNITKWASARKPNAFLFYLWYTYKIFKQTF